MLLFEHEDTFICQYCGRICKNANSLRNHERLCKENPNRPETNSGANFVAYNQKLKLGLVKRKPSNQYIKSKELGLSKPEISDETRKKIGNGWRGKKHTPEQLQKLSNTMQKVVRENPDKYSLSQIHQRTKHYIYNGVRIDGTWELLFAQYLDTHNIQWEKTPNHFDYFWEGKMHCYYPDFYLPEYDVYIEIKGYETEKDLEKYKVVNNLIVLHQKEIKEIENNRFNIIDLINKNFNN